jgi:hypothetical protein
VERVRPERVAMFTTPPELRPYSALSVWLSTLNSETVLTEGWNVIWFWTWSLRLMPLIMKFTVSSRLPAVLNANEPWPREGRGQEAGLARRHRAGMSRPRSTKVAAVERDLLHRALVDHLADGRGGALDRGRLGGHRDFLRSRCRAELDVEDDLLRDLQGDALTILGWNPESAVSTR